MSDTEQLDAALAAVHEEALKLFDKTTGEVHEKIKLIESIARYRYDVRSEVEGRRS